MRLLVYDVRTVCLLLQQTLFCLFQLHLQLLPYLFTFLFHPRFIVHFLEGFTEPLFLFQHFLMDLAVPVYTFLVIEGSIAIIILVPMEHHKSPPHHVQIEMGLLGLSSCFARVLLCIRLTAWYLCCFGVDLSLGLIVHCHFNFIIIAKKQDPQNIFDDQSPVIFDKSLKEKHFPSFKHSPTILITTSWYQQQNLTVLTIRRMIVGLIPLRNLSNLMIEPTMQGHINFIMQGSKDQFYQTAPSRILEKAAAFSINLKRYHDLPYAKSKSMAVQQKADFERHDIDYAIQRSKYQLNLYREKEQEDLKRRTLYQQKLINTAEKVEKNEVEILKKKEKKAESYNKHLDTTYKRYESEERRHRMNEKQQAYKLRKDLQEFYEKEAERKKANELLQVKVGTEYQKAVGRINRIHQLNEQYSLRAEAELEKQLRRNNHSNEIVTAKRRAVSVLNSEKPKIYEKNLQIFDEREKQHIQKYGNNQDGSLKAWKRIESDCEKTTKRLSQFFKKRVERWTVEKKRVDAQKAETPQKCLNILDKTSKSQFRKTVSTFYNSFVDHQNIVKKNKSLIKQSDQLKKDDLMNGHLDLRLKNNSSFKVNEKMQSMRQHARKIADNYL